MISIKSRGGPPGAAYVARAISNEMSPNIGIGFARWEGTEVAWALLYDEVIFVIEGYFELQANGELYRTGAAAVDTRRHRTGLWRPCLVRLGGAPGRLEAAPRLGLKRAEAGDEH